MKICVASRAPFLGGGEVAAERLALGLEQAGHEVFVVLGQRGPVWDRLSGAGLRCILAPMEYTDKRHPFRWVRSWLTLRWVLKRERPDLIHSNDLQTHQCMSGAAKGLDIQKVCHHRFYFNGGLIDWLDKFGADRHLFVSRALMDEMCSHSPRLTNSPRAVVHDGLPLPARPTEDARRTARQRLGLPADRVLVMFAGQIIECKGVAELIRAWSMLETALRAKAELIVAGEDLQRNGDYRMQMQALALEFNCPARFVGFQKNVAEWLLACDIAVVPSHVEPLGNATLEAMAHCLPVIGCAVGGIPEMIVPEQTGLLLPPREPRMLADAIERLLRDVELRHRLGEAGRRRCEELFSLDAHIRAVLHEYGQIHPAGAPLEGAAE